MQYTERQSSTPALAPRKPGKPITAQDFSTSQHNTPPVAPPSQKLRQLEKEKGQLEVEIKKLQLDRSFLLEKCQKLGIKVS